MTIYTKGIDASVISNSIVNEVPRICDFGIFDFFNNGYSRPSMLFCSDVVSVR